MSSAHICGEFVCIVIHRCPFRVVLESVYCYLILAGAYDNIFNSFIRIITENFFSIYFCVIHDSMACKQNNHSDGLDGLR